MKVLLATPYPPLRDGIAAYAAQVAAGLRAEGHEVDVCSPLPSAAPRHADFRTRAGLRTLRDLAVGFDQVDVQFQPEAWFATLHGLQFHRQAAAIARTFRALPGLAVTVHEVDHDRGRGRSREARAWRRLWAAVPTVRLHTEEERERFAAGFDYPNERIDVVHHGARFVKAYDGDRKAARAELGIADDAFIFLCIGFVQPHKGFDRAVRAFASLDRAERPLRLDVVGSVRVATSEHDAYVAYLERLADTTPGTHLHLGFVSDVRFDQWIAASDAVVIPYRRIWSSSVLERALLFDRPVVTTAVGGLADQSGGAARLVHDPEELIVAMAELADVAVTDSIDEPGGRPRDGAQARIRRRARALHDWIDPLDLGDGLDDGTTGRRLAGDMPPSFTARAQHLVYRVLARVVRPVMGAFERRLSIVVGRETTKLREQLRADLAALARDGKLAEGDDAMRDDARRGDSSADPG